MIILLFFLRFLDHYSGHHSLPHRQSHPVRCKILQVLFSYPIWNATVLIPQIIHLHSCQNYSYRFLYCCITNTSGPTSLCFLSCLVRMLLAMFFPSPRLWWRGWKPGSWISKCSRRKQRTREVRNSSLIRNEKALFWFEPNQ